MIPDQPEPLNDPICGCPLCAAVRESLSLDPAPPAAAGPAAAAPSYVLALLTPTVARWGSGAAGTGAAVTFSFMDAVPSYAGTTDASGFAPMTEAQRAAARQALATWSDVANIYFVETSDTANGGTGGSIRFGTNKQTSTSGYAYFPTGSLYDAGGDVYISNSGKGASGFNPGDAGFFTLVHEIGHAIGLKHPGNYGTSPMTPYLSTAEDNQRYTVMSYNANPSLASGKGLAAAPLLYDIAAAQYLYGANANTRTGNDSYIFSNTKTPFTAAIWDAGGTDVIDASAQTLAATIDLSPGGFSSIGPSGSGTAAAIGNVAVAYGATIENAIGGAGNDIILGNGVANVLTGGAGNDTLTGGGGDDTIEGSAGTDVAVFSGNLAAYDIAVGSDTTVITHLSGGSDGTDTLRNVEFAQFADQRVSLRPPVVAVQKGYATLGTTVRVDTLLSFTDPAGGSVTQYEFIDNTADGGVLKLGGTAQASGATVAVTASTLATLTFTAADRPTTDQIAVRAFSGVLWSPWSTVTLMSREPNRPPAVQTDKTLAVQEAGPATRLDIAMPRDPDGDALTVALVGLPTSGTIALASGTAVTSKTTLVPGDLPGLTYTPAAGFSGAAGTFSYKVTDSLGESSTQTVTLRVTPLSEISAGFNPYVYLASNPDLAAAFGTDAAKATDHYFKTGRFEGRSTDSFDPYAYLALNPDVAAVTGIDPSAAARHYLTSGRREGRRTTGFDPLAYLAANPDLAAAFGADPAKATDHYIRFGRAEGRGAGFDSYAYLAANPDLAAAFGIDPDAAVRHYITTGRREGRNAGFDALAYLAANPDLAAAFGTDPVQASEHYILYGRREGRGTSFDALGYLAANPDLASTFGLDRTRAEEHYIRFGRNEERPTSFNAREYLAANPDLTAAFGTDETLALTYKIRYGQRPRRDEAFDPLSYLAANPDLAALFGTDTAAAQRHYEQNGRAEGRPTRFNAFAYLAANPDLQAAFGDDEAKALEHFIRYGRREPRPDPLGYTPPASSIAALAASLTAPPAATPLAALAAGASFA